MNFGINALLDEEDGGIIPFLTDCAKLVGPMYGNAPTAFNREQIKVKEQELGHLHSISVEEFKVENDKMNSHLLERLRNDRAVALEQQQKVIEALDVVTMWDAEPPIDEVKKKAISVLTTEISNDRVSRYYDSVIKDLLATHYDYAAKLNERVERVKADIKYYKDNAEKEEDKWRETCEYKAKLEQQLEWFQSLPPLGHGP